MKRSWFKFIPAWAAAAIFWPGTSHAQSPVFAPGAMQPSTGTGIFHEMLIYRRIGEDPVSSQTSAHEFVALSQIAYGLSHNFSIQFDIPLVLRDAEFASGESDRSVEVADLTLLAKLRLWQHDPAPAETSRVSIIAGLQIPGDSEMRTDASHDAWNPMIGAVFSTVRERWGFNASVIHEFHTGKEAGARQQSDSTRADASLLFRIAPAEYADHTTGAWYLVTELNSMFDGNGDREMFLSPGVMFESRSFTIDAGLMLPVHQELNHRAETDFVIGAGIRISF